MALVERGIDFHHEIVDLSAKPDRLVELYERARPGSRGAAKVPLLEYGDDVVVESIDVARYVDAVRAAGPRLRPDESSELVDDFLDAWPRVERSYYAVLTATSQRDADAREDAFADSLRDLEDLLSANDDGPLLLGEAVSLAEVVAAPWVQRWGVTLPRFRRRDLERDILAPRGLDRVAAWTRAVAARPAAVETAAPPSEMIAAAEKYYVTYVTTP